MWPERKTYTRDEMNALKLFLPEGKAVLSSVQAPPPWPSRSLAVIFREPEMPVDLAYQVVYPWDVKIRAWAWPETTEAVLVHRRLRVVEDWHPEAQPWDLRALAGLKARGFFMPLAMEGRHRARPLAEENMSPEWHERLQAHAGQQVRCVRETTYTGPAEVVLCHLAMSLRPGVVYGNCVQAREVSFEVIPTDGDQP